MRKKLFGSIDYHTSRLIRWTRLQNVAHRTTAFPFQSTAGYPIEATLTLPTAGTAPFPVAILCPGIDDDGTVFTSLQTPIHPAELCQMGIAALHFDPTGRGKSWGEEDFGGAEHQDLVSGLLNALMEDDRIDSKRCAIIAISLGISMAVGGAIQAKRPPVFVLDWEGPSDREIMTSGGTRMAPAMGHKLSDDIYWHPREAARHVGNLPCGYVRLQAYRDHAQGLEHRHMWRMLRAVKGGAPWFQLNDHPINHLPERPIFLPSKRLASHDAILRICRRYLLESSAATSS